MLPFGVTIPATVPQRSEIPERLMNYPVFWLSDQRIEMTVLRRFFYFKFLKKAQNSEYDCFYQTT